jgi:hypothetical protein
MSNTKKVQLGTGAQADSAKQATATEPTREELLKRIAELESKQQQPKDLNQAIEFYKQKQRKIADLSNFEQHREELTKTYKVVEEKASAGDFNAKNYRLSLHFFREYGEGEKVFSVTNPLIIAACAEFILGKINEKAEQLRKEIAQ